MFKEEERGYKKSEVDYYIKRLDDDFQLILKSHTDRLENVKHNIAELATELNQYSQVVPQYKSEIESLRERLENIRGWAAEASKARYEKTDKEAGLANFITQILSESDKLDQLKPVDPPIVKPIDVEDFFEILASSRDVKLEEALAGFDFFDDNPYKAEAEKRLAKIKRKRDKK